MQEGMLWYAGVTNADLKEKIESAVVFFHKKYGQLPHACYVNSQLLEQELILEDNIKVQPSSRVIKNHIWLEFPQK